MGSWEIDRVQISGGFLADVNLQFPSGLTCIIGPRGSGKSTLAEAINLALSGLPPTASKARQDLTKANLGTSILSLTTKLSNTRGGYTIRRGYGQTPVLTASDERPITSVDLDRGTFLPLDAYSSLEIEAIADETLGPKRRLLLDELCASDMEQIHLQLSGHGRSLQANAEAIVATESRIKDITERLEELGDVKSRVEGLPTAGTLDGSPEFQAASKQHQESARESASIAEMLRALPALGAEIGSAVSHAKRDLNPRVRAERSINEALIASATSALGAFWVTTERNVDEIERAIAAALDEIAEVSRQLREAHASQEAAYLMLQHLNQEAGKAFEARTKAERDAATAAALEAQRGAAQGDLQSLHAQRRELKALYLTARDKVSSLREAVANVLQQQAGTKVRIRVLRNADVLEYQQQLLSALHGSRLKNQEDILKALCAIRPEDLATILRDDDVAEFELHTNFGRERGRKILDALRANLDALALEVLPIDDRIIIELNVSTGERDNFKDASELSRGQKCTALLPILLARRDTPLVIDQPEDNLDNHFIYETVVESIRRLKPNRQMIFITHNANIPVLGEAEMVVVMNSDGKRGFIEKMGTIDECRDEVIDLLEGGEEAFELRRKRYG